MRQKSKEKVTALKQKLIDVRAQHERERNDWEVRVTQLAEVLEQNKSRITILETQVEEQQESSIVDRKEIEKLEHEREDLRTEKERVQGELEYFKRQNETSNAADSADDDEIVNLKKQYEERIARLSQDLNC